MLTVVVVVVEIGNESAHTTLQRTRKPSCLLQDILPGSCHLKLSETISLGRLVALELG